MITVLAYQPYFTRAAALLAGLIALSVFCYAVFLLEAVAHAASRTHAQAQIEALTANVGVLEAQYLTATRELTPERAQSLGFVAPTQVSSVLADAPPRTLTVRTTP